MLVFLNVDCLVPARPAAAAARDAADTAAPLGLPGLEAVLDAWPQLRLVISSERRYRMTIEQLRELFAPRLRQRVIATTLLYGALSHAAAPTREQEILDWLRHAGAGRADWLALDDRADDFQLHADRLLTCKCFDQQVLDALHARLLERAARREAVLSIALGASAPRSVARSTASDPGEASALAGSTVRSPAALQFDHAARRPLPPITP